MTRPTAAELAAIRERDAKWLRPTDTERRALLAEVDALRDAIGASLQDLGLGTEHRRQRAEERLRLVLWGPPEDSSPPTLPWPARCRWCDLVTEDPDACFAPPDTVDEPDEFTRCDASPNGIHMPVEPLTTSVG